MDRNHIHFAAGEPEDAGSNFFQKLLGLFRIVMNPQQVISFRNGAY